MSGVASASKFFLFAGSETISPANVFYYVDNEWIAAELCKLFESEFGQFCENNFSHVVVDGNDTTQLVRLYAAIDELSVYHDPDPGTYDPKPTQELLQRASYYFRAIQWESLLESLRGQKSGSTQTDGSKQGSTKPSNEQDILAFEHVRLLLEKHRLMFLFFAVPKQINPLATGNKWQQDSLTQDQFPKFKREEIDDNGEFLLTYRRRLEQFVQSCYRKFGSGAGNKPRMLTEDGNVVDIEGGTLPAWYLDEGACVYLDESAEQILASLRDCIRKGHSRLLQPFATAIKESLHDQGKSKWYASEPVRWEFVSRLDSILHELRICELEQLETNKVVDSVEPQCTSQSDKPTSPDAADEDTTKGIPDEDDRNSSLILLMLFAQAYYKMLESATSISDWVTAMDLELNSSYIWTVQNLNNLLCNSKHLSDFPEKFEPLFEDLYPTTIIDVDWPMMVAPHADGFLSAVQRYVLKKGTKEPEEGSPAWNMVQLFRPGVETAIKRAENYNRRLRKAQQAMFGEPRSNKPQDAATRTDSDNARAEESQPGSTSSNVQITIPPGANWSEVAIRFLDAHNIQVTFRDQSQRFHFTQMNMADGRSNLKPTKQWELLYSFARDNGVINWGSKSASSKLKKQKQELSEKLSALFAIVGEPIVYLEKEKGWKTVFRISES